MRLLKNFRVVALSGSFAFVALALFGCGAGSADIVPAPKQVSNASYVNGQFDSFLNWDPVPGAVSYNLYMKSINKSYDDATVEERTVTKQDTKISNVTSPFSTVQFIKCNTTYFYALASVNTDGVEGELGYVSSSGAGEVICTP